MEIIAHRGASYDAPENTLASFKLGWEQKADADELDIYLTKDNQIVVLHDADTKRVSGQNLKPSEHTLAELQALDVGSWKGPKWAGEKIPALDAVLATIPPGKRLFIEIKCGPEVIPPLAEALHRSGHESSGTVIIGFSLPTMEAAKARFPKIPVCWLASFKKDASSGAWSPSVDELIAQAKSARMDGLDLNARPEVLDAEAARKIKAAGLKFYVWTVDDPTVAKKMRQIGVDGITTNRPEWLRRQLE